MRVKPFKALRPVPEAAARVAAPPYDTLDRAEAAAMAAGNPDSFLHVSRAEIDLDSDTDPYADAVYKAARVNLDGLCRRGTLQREASPCLYLYRLQMGAHAQTGIVVCSHVEDYLANRILRHEKTRADKEDDRTRYVLALRAHTGPVFLAYRDVPAVDAAVADRQRRAPLFDFTAADGVRHTVWRVEESRGGPLLNALAGVPRAYIADGHHRAAAAARAAITLRQAAGDPAEPAEYDGFLSVFFPASQLKILPYHRCVRDLNGLSPREFLARIGERFDVEEISRPEDLSGEGRCALYLEGRWRKLSWTPPVGEPDPAARLDVAVLQNRLLAPVLGIDDPRTDSRIDFVGGIRGIGELERRVDSGRDAAAFAMGPVTVERMMEIADAGMEMPPKSTWFEPKMRSGLLLHTF